MNKVIPADALQDHVGQEVGVTDWLTIEQERIDQFADATDDHQYIHVDAERAAQTPFGGTIAHGFLTLSLLSALSSRGGGLKLENTVMGINYGLDRVRFVNPVRSGQRIRARFNLSSAEEKTPGRYLTRYAVTVEIEGEEKPALVADWLGMTVVDKNA
ncbi:MAG: MaoC family dehydratase [Gammaproteobacteria bacterium]|nr:MaoC family dehydratase [Gammaproteobacteria bacterium]MDE0479700.1 MaoC family dehydratase [Gammaproteobacteria bacterium]MXX07176.1 MaoC family dehydratase [Gammaproteobacteria bacterium]MXY91357.1 MaoC family dehydratase [Gammaproteobacteria bacterium]MYE29756.1 MaoC family dehydratase [Gammaproteobacteria bacterium]